MSNPKQRLGLSPEFNMFLGMFHGTFASLNLTTDFAIGKFLNLEAAPTHLLTSGMMFGPKARLLADLISRSDDPKKPQLLAPFNRLRGDSKRDVIAHGYVWSDAHTVRFIQRITSGEYTVRSHSFTLKEFAEHAIRFATDAAEFYTVLGATQEVMDAFGNAALSLDRKSKTSPQKPQDKA